MVLQQNYGEDKSKMPDSTEMNGPLQCIVGAWLQVGVALRQEKVVERYRCNSFQNTKTEPGGF